MTSVTFHGHVPMTYHDYIDLATGKTLVCQPGQTYNIAPASGNIRSVGTTMPADGRFVTNMGREAIAMKSKTAGNPPADMLPDDSSSPEGEER